MRRHSAADSRILARQWWGNQTLIRSTEPDTENQSFAAPCRQLSHQQGRREPAKATERNEGLPAVGRSARQEIESHLAIAEQCNRPVRSPGHSSVPHHAMRRRGKQAGQMRMERVGFHYRPAPQAATSHSWRKSGRRCDSRSRTEYRSSRPPPKTTYGAALQSNRSGHTRNSLYRDGQWLHGWLPPVAGMRGPAYNPLVLVADEFLLLHTMLLASQSFAVCERAAAWSSS